MSILPVLAQSDQSVETLAFLLGSIGVAGAIIAAAGVFQPRSVVGPSRINPDEPLVPLWLILLIGIGVWIFVPSAYLSLKTGSSSGATTKPTTQLVAMSAREQVGLTVGSAALVLATLIMSNVLMRPDGLRRLGLGIRTFIRSGVPVAVSIGAVLPLMFVAQHFTQVLWDQVGMQHPDAHPLLEIFKEQADPGLRVLVILSAVLLAPAFEEMLFRGHMQTAILHSISPRGDSAAARWIAILLTSGAFALVHEQIWMMPPIFILSVCLGYVYERTGNLWVPIGIHAVFNAANIALFIFSRLGH